MRIYRSNEFRTLLLPLLLAVALLASIAIAACTSGTAEEPGTAPAAGEQVDGDSHDDEPDGHADGADHDDADGSEGGETHADDGDSHDDEVSAGHDEPQEIVVTMTDQLTFGPEEIVVPAGEPVRLVINNEGQALHDFTVEQIPVTHMHHDGGSVDEDHMSGEGHSEFDLHMALDGGDAGVLEFVPGEPGEYVFHCTVPGHTEGGMHGELIVRATD